MIKETQKKKEAEKVDGEEGGKPQSNVGAQTRPKQTRSNPGSRNQLADLFSPIWFNSVFPLVLWFSLYHVHHLHDARE